MRVQPAQRLNSSLCDQTFIGKVGRLCEEERLDDALHSADLLNLRGIPVPRDAIYCLLQQCTKKKDLAGGRRVRMLMASSGLDSIAVLGDHLIRLFALCGSLVDAKEVFRNVSNPTVYTWNAIISAHANLAEGERALELYDQMQLVGVHPNRVTFLCILKACGSVRALNHGRKIHDEIDSSGLKSDVVISNTLIDMYCKCGSLNEARRVFEELQYRDEVSWGAMIAGYALCGHGYLALELLKKMQQEGIQPSEATLSCALKACGSIGAICQGRLFHDQINRRGLLSDVVIGATLVDMYVKCGNLVEACVVFDRLAIRDVVSWGIMISGYTQLGHGLPALELYWQMLKEQLKPDRVIFLCILKASCYLGALELGRLIHEQLVRNKLESDVVIGNTLVDMYAKCGSLVEAYKVFNKLPSPDKVSWGAIISGYAQCSNGTMVQQCLKELQQQGVEPDDVMYTSILSACSHAGLLEEGCQYFKSMIIDHCITPSIDHCNCMVDLLGRAGCLDEAEDLLQTMPVLPNIIGWTSLLTGCKTFNNLQLARQCFIQVVQLDPNEASAYVLMSNMYADASMWEDVEKVQDLRKCVGAWKKPGQACIGTGNKVREFIVGENYQPQNEEIFTKLRRVRELLKEEGYMPHWDLALESTLQQDRESGLT